MPNLVIFADFGGRFTIFEGSYDTVRLESGATTFTLSVFPILCAISDCVTSEISRVRHYLQKSADKSIFIQGRDHHGDTYLIIASREKASLIVSMLLNFSAKVNATNNNGRTTLIEAYL